MAGRGMLFLQKLKQKPKEEEPSEEETRPPPPAEVVATSGGVQSSLQTPAEKPRLVCK